MERLVRYHGAPMCRCGSRATQRVEGKFLVRRCSKCMGTYWYRLHDGILVPHTKETAEAMEEAKSG